MASNDEGISSENAVVAHSWLLMQMLKMLEMVEPGSAEAILDSTKDAIANLSPNEEAVLHIDALKAATSGFEGREYSSDDEQKGHVIATSLQLSCLLDELESILPGVSSRTSERAIELLENMLQKKLRPEWKAAVDRLREVDKLAKLKGTANAPRS